MGFLEDNLFNDPDLSLATLNRQHNQLVRELTSDLKRKCGTQNLEAYYFLRNLIDSAYSARLKTLRARPESKS